MRNKTQKQIVLEDLVAAGDRGVSGSVWHQKFITRYASRIGELKEELKRDGLTIKNLAPGNKVGHYALKHLEKPAPQPKFDDKTNTMRFW